MIALRILTRNIAPPHFVELGSGTDSLERRRAAIAAHREGSPDWKRGLPVFGGHAEPSGRGARLAARAHVELPQDRGDVVVDRFRRQEEPFRDLSVAEPLRDQGEDLELACREVRRVPPGRAAWPAR